MPRMRRQDPVPPECGSLGLEGSPRETGVLGETPSRGSASRRYLSCRPPLSPRWPRSPLSPLCAVPNVLLSIIWRVTKVRCWTPLCGVAVKARWSALCCDLKSARAPSQAKAVVALRTAANEAATRPALTTTRISTSPLETVHDKRRCPIIGIGELGSSSRDKKGSAVEKPSGAAPR
jgi:hypothetical protein